MGHGPPQGLGMKAAPRTQSQATGVGQGCTFGANRQGLGELPCGHQASGCMAGTPTRLPPSRLLQERVLSPKPRMILFISDRFREEGDD